VIACVTVHERRQRRAAKAADNRRPTTTFPGSTAGSPMKLDTLAVHAGYTPDPTTRSSAVPIYST
jgi:hypothetical protein